MLHFKFDVLEDILPADMVEEWELDRAHAPDPLVAWWKTALSRLEVTPRFANPARNPDMVEQELGEDEADIHVMLCSRESLKALTSTPNALGVHLVTNPDSDPFGDESNACRQYRTLIVSDRTEFLADIYQEAEKDDFQERYLPEYIEAHAITVFHEIAHVLLFAENANLLSPADIESLSDSGEIANDLFDHSTGYGMRPLMIDGQEIWADTIEEASPLMEQYVEDLGRKMMLSVMKDDLHPLTLLEAMGLTEDVKAIYAASQTAA
jgi:hypothetical protein